LVDVACAGRGALRGGLWEGALRGGKFEGALRGGRFEGALRGGMFDGALRGGTDVCVLRCGCDAMGGFALPACDSRSCELVNFLSGKPTGCGSSTNSTQIGCALLSALALFSDAFDLETGFVAESGCEPLNVESRADGLKPGVLKVGAGGCVTLEVTVEPLNIDAVLA
jgi:hypothetical protein